MLIDAGAGHYNCANFLNVAFVFPSSALSGSYYYETYDNTYSRFIPTTGTYTISQNAQGKYQITTTTPVAIYKVGLSQQVSLGAYVKDTTIDVTGYKALIVKYYYSNEGAMQACQLPNGFYKDIHSGEGVGQYTYAKHMYGSQWGTACSPTTYTWTDTTFTSAFGAQEIIGLK